MPDRRPTNVEFCQEESDEDSENITRNSHKKKTKRSYFKDDSDDQTRRESEEDNFSPRKNDSSPRAEFVTPTPRSSDRLRQKSERRRAIPQRKDVWDKIGDISPKIEKKSLMRRSLTSDFVRGSSRYVMDKTDKFLSSSDSDLSDFIDDSDEPECKTKRKSKPTKRKKKKISNDEQSFRSNSNTDTGKRKKSSVSKRKKRKKKIVSSDEMDSDDNSELDRATCGKFSKVGGNSVISDDEENSNDGLPDKIGSINGVQTEQTNANSSTEELNCDTDKASQNSRNLPRRMKSSRKEMEGQLLAKISAKRKRLKTGTPNATDTVLVGESESNDAKNTNDDHDTDLDKSTEELFYDEDEEGESDKEFVVDDNDVDVDSDGITEFSGRHLDDTVLAGSINNILETSNKKLKKFKRVCSHSESDESDEPSSPEMTEIYNYIKENNVSQVKVAIGNNPSIIEELGSKRRTLLHHAVICGSLEVTKLLVELGCDKLALDVFWLPPFAYAVLYGHVACLKTLTENVIELHLFNRLLEDHHKLSILHFTVYGWLAMQAKEQNVCLHDCLKLFFELDDTFCLTLMERKDFHGFTPLVAAIASGQDQCVKFLLSKGAIVTDFLSQNGGNLLHFAVECFVKASLESDENKPSCCLRALLTTDFLRNNIDATDYSGFTPLMYVAQNGNHECVLELLEGGASVRVKDKHGTTSLHLAAASGDTDCVKSLLKYGHEIDCLDSFGWPPLLYANFAAKESCVLALMEPNPKQIFVLGGLLKKDQSDKAKEDNYKVVKDVLIALANQDAYYRVFNDFIRRNPEFLEENDKGVLHQTWRGILDFDNKKTWFQRKLLQARENVYGRHISLVLIRDNIFESAMDQLDVYSGRVLRGCRLSVTFKDEPGICTGPRREFFVNVCKDIVDPKRKLFLAADNNQYSLLPNAFLRDRAIQDGPEQNRKPSSDHTSDATKEKIDETAGECKVENESRNPPPDFMDQASDDAAIAEVDLNNLRESSLNDFDNFNDDAVITSVDLDNLRNSPSDYLNDLSDDAAIAGIDLDNLIPPSMRSPLTDSECRASPDLEYKKAKKLSFSTFVDEQLARNLGRLRFLGKFVGLAICRGDFINLHLSKPLVKQILGIQLHHPDDLSYMDYQLHKNMVSSILESDDVSDLMLPSNLDVINPWNNRVTTVRLFPGNKDEEILTEKNKCEFMELVSKHKLTLLIEKELNSLCQGLYQVIPKEFFSLFTADEFSLLINGVGKIDVKDWQKNTKYPSDEVKERNEVKWFWEIVSELKEEEKALLLKFSTGSPCLPAGGFAELQGLGGATKFQLVIKSEHNKIPTAATCFNMLKLTSYDKAKQLKDKLMIAIRHGTEGFSFS